MIERHPFGPGLVVVFVDFQTAEGRDRDNHQIDDDDRVDITVLEDLERPHPGDRREDY